MAEVMLHRAGILPIVRQLVATRVAEHMRVHGEGKLGPFSYPREHLAEPGCGHRRRALGKKDVPPLRLLAVEAAKIADLAAAHRIHARHSVLDALHVEEPVRQVDLIPAQRAQLSRPQAMSGMR